MTTDDASTPKRSATGTPRQAAATEGDGTRPLDARLLARRLEAWAGDGTLACWIEDDARTYELALALARRLAENEA